MALLVKPTKVGDVTVDKALRELRGALSSKVDTPLLLMWGGRNVGASAIDYWLWPGFTDTAAYTAPAGVSMPCPKDGTIKNLRLCLAEAGTGGASDITYILQVNGKDTPLQLTVSNVAVGSFAAAAREVQVKAGDRLAIVTRKSAAITASNTYPVLTAELV